MEPRIQIQGQIINQNGRNTKHYLLQHIFSYPNLESMFCLTLTEVYCMIPGVYFSLLPSYVPFYSSIHSRQHNLNYKITSKQIRSNQAFRDILISIHSKLEVKLTSVKEPCTPNFGSQWIQFDPKLKNVPHFKPRISFNLTHHGDELGLYTEQEERNFDYVLNKN